jgi:tryptophan 7-halogenase
MILNNLAIVGGGTSGMVTALILRKTQPTLRIDLIESDKIGIVGVGEGSTEHWQSFSLHCDIDLSRMIKETDATFKYGINFDNWHGDGTNYFHSVSSSFSMESQTGSKMVFAHLIATGATPKDLIHPHVEPSLHRAPYWSINQFHFNTFKLNEFLHKLCEERGINVIKAEIDQVNLTEDGAIKNLVASDGRTFDYDFYVDSTGFHRLLLHKTMGVPWKSYQKYLPMNSAIAFPTERLEDIPSWTLSKAMNSGWLWRIPTQERFGNGYVFNDSFMDFDQAQQEVEQLYGHPVEVAKKIKFDAGCLEKFWVKNCAAIGLSSSFVEPLEASSIGTSIQQAFLFASLLPSYIPGTEYSIKKFNSASSALVENILDFVALHYITKREDTEFWKSVKLLPRTDSLEEKLEIFRHKFPSGGDFMDRRLMFKESNWIMVLHALHLIPLSVAKREMDLQPAHVRENIDINIEYMLGRHDYEIKDFVNQRTALQWIIDNPEQR